MNTTDLFLCPLFHHIPLQEREAFAASLNYTTKHFAKGAYIARQGDSLHALYVLCKGRVKTEMIPDSGNLLNIETISAPNPLAPAFLFAEKNQFPVDVIALEACEVAAIPKATVLKLLASHASFLQAYMAFNSNRTTFLSERIKLLAVKTIKGKLAHYILNRAQHTSFTIDLNQTQLADYFGVTRPSLARSLSELQADKIIKLEKQQGEILQPNTLKELITQ